MTDEMHILPRPRRQTTRFKFCAARAEAAEIRATAG